MISNAALYHHEIPEFIKPYLLTDAMQRLKQIDMNCGMNYTSYQRFTDIEAYSRFHHSLGCALIVWHFTHDQTQTLAALFHDIATPVFSHVIDFVYHDHLNQNMTENRTEAMIQSDEGIMNLLRKDGIRLQDVSDYHMYPIADNDSPKLSADRLEYILGDILDFRFADEKLIRSFYEDLYVSVNEEGIEELAFHDEQIASGFALFALKCGKVYSGDENRYAMERLAMILRKAMQLGILDENDLYSSEDAVMKKLSVSVLATDLQKFRKENRVIHTADDDPEGIIVDAKKRYIDPLCQNGKRVSSLNAEISRQIKEFLDTDYHCPIRGLINE